MARWMSNGWQVLKAMNPLRKWEVAIVCAHANKDCMGEGVGWGAGIQAPHLAGC